MKTNETYKVASFFSGCGGMDLGIEGGFTFLGKRYSRHKTKIVMASDFAKEACEIYNMNFRTKCLHQDIRYMQSREVPDHDIMTGGFPCQSFSVVAQNPKRLGYKDEKGKLFFELCRILRDKQPKVFVAENVKGLLSANNRETFPLILKEFESAGYHLKYKVLNTSLFGIPQKRERVFIVGFRNRKKHNSFSFPEPLMSNTPTPLKEVLEEDIDEKYYFSEKAVYGMQKSTNSKIMNKGRTQDIEMPCNTITSHLAKYSLNGTDPVLFDNKRYRMFTEREAARIQSFPESFKLSDSRAKNYRVIGNAVAPVIMWHLTRKIIKCLNG